MKAWIAVWIRGQYCIQPGRQANHVHLQNRLVNCGLHVLTHVKLSVRAQEVYLSWVLEQMLPLKLLPQWKGTSVKR